MGSGTSIPLFTGHPPPPYAHPHMSSINRHRTHDLTLDQGFASCASCALPPICLFCLWPAHGQPAHGWWGGRGGGGAGGRDALERPYTVGGGGVTPHPPPLPMFEADSQNFASAPSVPRGFTLKKFRPAFGGAQKGTLGGGGSQPNPHPPDQTPPPPPPSTPF